MEALNEARTPQEYHMGGRTTSISPDNTRHYWDNEKGAGTRLGHGNKVTVEGYERSSGKYEGKPKASHTVRDGPEASNNNQRQPKDST